MSKIHITPVKHLNLAYRLEKKKYVELCFVFDIFEEDVEMFTSKAKVKLRSWEIKTFIIWRRELEKNAFRKTKPCWLQFQ